MSATSPRESGRTASATSVGPDSPPRVPWLLRVDAPLAEAVNRVVAREPVNRTAWLTGAIERAVIEYGESIGGRGHDPRQMAFKVRRDGQVCDPLCTQDDAHDGPCTPDPDRRRDEIARA